MDCCIVPKYNEQQTVCAENCLIYVSFIYRKCFAMLCSYKLHNSCTFWQKLLHYYSEALVKYLVVV